MNKFSIIVAYYNQINYIEDALKSIFIQNYDNIEIIIADDCSKDFDEKVINKISKECNVKNFEIKFVRSKENVGTVKNLNNALKYVTGDIIIVFAADDKLYDKNVIANFNEEFKDKNKKIVTSQCILYDHYFKENYGNYVNAKNALKLNDETSHEIYVKMCEGCFYGSGATAYRKEIFEEYGEFNDEYKFVEDWSYWVYVLREGEKIYYADFTTLCHRDGGISHGEFTKETLPPHVRQYYNDILNIYNKEIFPYFDRFTLREKYNILSKYEETTKYYAHFAPELISYLNVIDDIKNKDKKLSSYYMFGYICDIFKIDLISKIIVQIKHNRAVPMTICLWTIICLLFINRLKISKVSLLFIYIVIYVICYYCMYIFDKLCYYSMNKFRNRRREKNV